jgi:hypothetical protein
MLRDKTTQLPIPKPIPFIVYRDKTYEYEPIPPYDECPDILFPLECLDVEEFYKNDPLQCPLADNAKTYAQVVELMTKLIFNDYDNKDNLTGEGYIDKFLIFGYILNEEENAEQWARMLTTGTSEPGMDSIHYSEFLHELRRCGLITLDFDKDE